MKEKVIIVCWNGGNKEKNVQVDEGEQVQVDLNSSLGRQRMRGWGRGGGLVKVKRDFVRSVFFFYSILTDFNGVLQSL